MENEITFAEIKELLKEAAEARKESEQARKENEQARKENEQARKENEQARKEKDAEMQALAAAHKETEAAIREFTIETRKTVNDLAKQLGGIGNSNGYFAEQFFAQSLKEKKALGGIKFDEVEVNLKHKRKDIVDEFDIVMYNGDSIAIVEVKYVAALSDLKRLIEKKAANFKYLYPEYAGYKIYLALAGLSFENDMVKQQGLEAGVAILEAKGDHAEITADNMRAY